MRNFKFLAIPMLLLFLAAWHCAVAAVAVDAGGIHSRLRPSLVRVRTYDVNGKLLASGGGVVIALPQPDGTTVEGVATSRHLFAGALRAEIQTDGGKPLPVESMLAEDIDADMVLLDVDKSTSSLAPAPFSATPPMGTQSILTPPQTQPQQSELNVVDVPAFGTMYRLMLPIAPDRDGCPMVNETGELLGLGVFTLQEPAIVNLVIPAARMQKMHPGTPRPLAAWAKAIPSPWLTSPEGLLFQVRGWLAVKDIARATALLARLKATGQVGVLATFYRGYCQLAQQTPAGNQAALATFSTLVKQAPTFAPAQTYLGKAYLALAQDTKALPILQQAQRLQPDDADTLCALGQVYCSLKRFIDAVPPLKEAARLQPDNAEARDYYERASIKLMQFAPDKQQQLWGLAACALLTARNGEKHDTLGGMTLTPKTVKYCKTILNDWWGVQTREELLSTLNDLDESGHRAGFINLGQQVSMLSEKAYSSWVQQLVKNPEALNSVKIARKYYPLLGARKSLVAWDYARYISLCRWGYVAGLLSEQEAWQKIMPAAQRIQDAYDSWQELGENYIIGIAFWSDDQAERERCDYALSQLLTDEASPWTTLPWKLTLTR